MDAFLKTILEAMLGPQSPEFVARVHSELVTGWTIDTISRIWGAWYAVAIFISFILCLGIVYCMVRLRQIRRIENDEFRKASTPVTEREVPRTHMKWHKVLENASSHDERQWRLAILEADIMLNELLDTLGYKGETMAEKMKQVVRGDFNTIDVAWEAHKIRNRVAHDGSDYPLPEREKNRVIGMYKQVFQEFKFITEG